MPNPVTAAAAQPSWLDQYNQIASSSPWWWGPVLTAALAMVGAWIAIRFDRRKSLNQELIKKRLELYNKCVPLVNDIYCYFRQIGPFRQFAPDDLVNRKRELDGLIHMNGPLFSSRRLERAYFRFINECFSVRHGAGTVAKLRKNPELLKKHFKDEWRDEWTNSFDLEQPCKFKVVESSYTVFVELFAWQIGARMFAPFRSMPLIWFKHNEPTLALRHKTLAKTESKEALNAAKHDAISKLVDEELSALTDTFDDGSLVNTILKTQDELTNMLAALKNKLEKGTRYRLTITNVDIIKARAGTINAMKVLIIAAIV